MTVYCIGEKVLTAKGWGYITNMVRKHGFVINYQVRVNGTYWWLLENELKQPKEDW